MIIISDPAQTKIKTISLFSVCYPHSIQEINPNALIGSALFQATCAMKFVQLQLLELARDCDNMIQNSLVTSHWLQNKLEMLLCEFRVGITNMVKFPPKKITRFT